MTAAICQYFCPGRAVLIPAHLALALKHVNLLPSLVLFELLCTEAQSEFVSKFTCVQSL